MVTSNAGTGEITKVTAQRQIETRPRSGILPLGAARRKVMEKTVYLGLGSNQGDRRALIEDAVARLGKLGKVQARSSLYETEPVEMAGQPWFLNCALALETDLMPKQLLTAVLRIEQEMGRRRAAGARKGPRTIDIDILLFAASVVETAGLTIPHPALHQRRFVLEPLAEIAPEARHPVLQRSIRELRDALPPNAGAVRKLANVQS
jgi:2-amino-4-hydroxy-6-hydroxymethyldihydropteridine diphosphokinase